MDGQEDILRAQDPDVRVRLVAAVAKLLLAAAVIVSAIALGVRGMFC